MKVIYSIGAQLAGGGIGNTAYHDVRGLLRHGLLQRLLCGSFRPTEIPAERIRSLNLASRGLRKLAALDRTRLLGHAESVLFDAWASHRLEPADLLVVWGGYGLRSMQRARAAGMTTVTVRASSHPRYQAQLLREEHNRWGLTFGLPERIVRRSTAELANADYVLIPSDFVRASFVAQGYSEAKLLQAHFGVDTARFCPDGSHMARPFRVLFVGQVGLRKGVPYLLEAWRKLGWTDAELWLVGRVDPSARPILERWRGLAGVRYLEHTPEPASLYRQADVFAFPSIEEGSALVTYEALASGMPVVTTPNAGSLVQDGREGFIVPIRDVDALAERLQRLRQDERLRHDMARAARETAVALSWEAHGDSVARLLQAL